MAIKKEASGPRNFTCPYTGSVYDFDSLPGHSALTNKPGKWSKSGEPYDDIALANYDYSIVASPEAQAKIKETYTNAVAAIKKQIES